MKITEYAWMDTEELLLFVINRDISTPLEFELAQRLIVAIDKMKGLDHGDDARGESESGRQASFDG
jgi:hypothetical protein